MLDMCKALGSVPSIKYVYSTKTEIQTSVMAYMGTYSPRPQINKCRHQLLGEAFPPTTCLSFSPSYHIIYPVFSAQMSSDSPDTKREAVRLK
jgi:hypothetical protein